MDQANGEQQQNEGAMEIARYLNDNQRREILNNPNIQDENFRHTIIDISRLVKSVYDRLISDDLELQVFQNQLSNSTCGPTGRIIYKLRTWIDKREELIKVLKSSADELDNSTFRATLGRLFGSSIDVLYNIDSICDQTFSDFLTKQAYGVSYALGFVTQTFCSIVPSLTYVGLLSSLGDIMNSKLIVHNVLKMIKEDMELFEEIQDWVTESVRLDQSVNNMFHVELDKDLVAEIEKYLPEVDSYSKIFTLIFIATIGRNPSFMRNTQDNSSAMNWFLQTVYLFSKSEVAEEWFDRCLKIDHNLVAEALKLEVRKELMELIKLAPDSESTMEVGGQVMKMKHVPHLIQASINSISIYFSSKELMNGVKHKHSDELRDLMNTAKQCLDFMIAFKVKIESRRSH